MQCQRILFTLLLFALIYAPAVLAEPPRPLSLHGVWITEGYGSRVNIQHCRENAQSICGKIVWLWDEKDENGEPVKDLHNPKRNLRGRPLIGIELLNGFRSVDETNWQGGTIYNPDDGKSYRSSLTLISQDILEVKGCVLVFCRRQIWRRMNCKEEKRQDALP